MSVSEGCQKNQDGSYHTDYLKAHPFLYAYVKRGGTSITALFLYIPLVTPCLIVGCCCFLIDFYSVLYITSRT